MHFLKVFSRAGAASIRISKILFLSHFVSTTHFCSKECSFLLVFILFVVKRPFLSELSFKGCVRNIFTSLFRMSKGKYFWNKEKILFHFESSFCSWDNQILIFQIFKCHDIIKCLSIKRKTFYWIIWEVNTVWSWNLAGLCITSKEKILSENYIENMTQELIPDPF